jgi:hypothetical protein
MPARVAGGGVWPRAPAKDVAGVASGVVAQDGVQRAAALLAHPDRAALRCGCDVDRLAATWIAFSTLCSSA